MHVLQHQAEQAAQVGEVELANVDAVDGDPSALSLVEPHQQVDQRRLAGSGGADDADALARPDLEAHVLQDLVLVRDLHHGGHARIGRLRGELVVVARTRRVEHDVARRPARAARRPRRRLDATGSSSSLKIRSDDAMADCRTLNFSDMSLIGRKNRCEY